MFIINYMPFNYEMVLELLDLVIIVILALVIYIIRNSILHSNKIVDNAFKAIVGSAALSTLYKNLSSGSGGSDKDKDKDKDKKKDKDKTKVNDSTGSSSADSKSSK